MDKNQLRQQVEDFRQFMLDEGILGDYFLEVEKCETTKPKFVEYMIGSYLCTSTTFLDKLEHLVNTEPVDLQNVECLIQKLLGGSASIGVHAFSSIVGIILVIFRATNFNSLNTSIQKFWVDAAFKKIKEEHAALKTDLESYVELLRRLRRVDPHQDEASYNQANHDGSESTDSNEVSSY